MNCRGSEERYAKTNQIEETNLRWSKEERLVRGRNRGSDVQRKREKSSSEGEAKAKKSRWKI